MSYWVAGATVVAGIGGALINKKASDNAAAAAGNLQYQPINLEKLQSEAKAAAEQNYLGSIALEAKGSPDLAAARTGLNKQVAGDLAGEGNLPIDVQNKVTRSAITGANSAGFEGAAGPITAAMLGLTSQDIRNQNQQKAMGLLASNPLPQAGLDPGALASADIANQNAMNWFNVAKTGALANANQSSTDATSGLLGKLPGLVGMFKGGGGGGNGAMAANAWAGAY
jgi:hypothetical protein